MDKHYLTRTLQWRHTGSLSEIRDFAKPQDLLLEDTASTILIVLMV